MVSQITVPLPPTQKRQTSGFPREPWRYAHSGHYDELREGDQQVGLPRTFTYKDPKQSVLPSKMGKTVWGQSTTWDWRGGGRPPTMACCKEKKFLQRKENDRKINVVPVPQTYKEGWGSDRPTTIHKGLWLTKPPRKGGGHNPSILNTQTQTQTRYSNKQLVNFGGKGCPLVPFGRCTGGN